MLKAAREELQGIREIEDIQPKTPEFMEVRLAVQRRVLSVQQLLNPTATEQKKMLEDYLDAGHRD